MKSVLLPFITIFLSLSVIAQGTEFDFERTKEEPNIPNIHFKYNFTSVVDPFAPYLQLSVEYPIAKRLSIENELGWAKKRLDLFGQLRPKHTGIRSRNQLHIFLPDRRSYLNHTFDLHLVGRYIVFPTKEYEFSRFENRYRQQFEISPRYYDIGGLIGYSLIFYLPKTPISIEIGSALGAKRSFISQRGDIPEDAELVNGLEFEVNLIPPISPNRVHFITLMNLKMGVFF